MDDKTKLMLEQLNRIQALIESGYAGVDQATGRIVDRREHREALPIQKNTLLGVPEPKAVNQ